MRGGATSVFEANLSVLEKLTESAETSRRLRSTLPAEEMEVQSTPSGYPTCRASDIWVYSRYDPMKEARRLLEREIPVSTEVCIFENFGLGYHVEAFLDRCPDAKAIVVEPDIRWFRTAIEARDLRRVLASDRVLLLLEAPSDLVRGLLGEATNVQVLRIRALAAKDAEYFGRVSEEIRSFAARKDINKNTLARFGRRWVRNLIRNLDLIPRAGGVQELQGSFSGVPCLVLAAGPSLDEILPYLDELRERFLLVSVDTSYRAALNVGVTPDFLVVVDPQYWNARQLDGCRIDSTILVSESSTYPSVFHRPVGSLYFCGSLFPLGQYIERAVGDKGKLGAGGSVSTTTWDFARLLGCSPLVCAGLDLGFPLLKTHFRGGFFEERMHTLSSRVQTAEAMAFHFLRDAAPYPVINNSGTLTLTDRRLVVYKWWFENQLTIHPEAHTINPARYGIKIEGMQGSSLGRLFDYPVVRNDIDDRLRAITRRNRKKRNSDTVRAALVHAVLDLTRELKRLRNGAMEATRATDRLEGLIERSEDPSAILSELDALDGSIASQSTRDIAGFLIHSTAQAILDRRIIDISIEKDRKQAIDDSRELYTRLGEAALFHLELLEKAARRLEPIKITGLEPC